MNQRTHEGHMDWEYNGSAPCDPSSPFTHIAQRNLTFGGGFATPSKGNGRPNPFASLPSPSKSQPPRTPLFTPQLPAKTTAPPFRNPAFTTPRQPIDESIFSEASGAEDSPAPTEASDMPDDTPEVDHMGDVSMRGAILPTKVSKLARYGRFPHAKKHSSGKGEIRNNRDSSRPGSLHKRKRHNMDVDVSSVVRYQPRDEFDDETDASVYSEGTGKKSAAKGGLLHKLDQHRNAPQNLQQWLQLALNGLGAAFVAWVIVGTFWAVYTDLRTAKKKAQFETLGRIADCQHHYTANSCADRNIPALRIQCDEWFDCMSQNPESVMMVKVTMREIAEILNEFAETLGFKACGFIFVLTCVLVLFNRTVSRGLSPSVQAAPYNPQPITSSGNGMNRGDDGNFMWIPVQTPRTKRHAMLNDGSDSDSPFAQPTPLMLSHYTPSKRRSPTKGGERARSPIKYSRSPSKDYYS